MLAGLRIANWNGRSWRFHLIVCFIVLLQPLFNFIVVFQNIIY